MLKLSICCSYGGRLLCLHLKATVRKIKEVEEEMTQIFRYRSSPCERIVCYRKPSQTAGIQSPESTQM